MIIREPRSVVIEEKHLARGTPPFPTLNQIWDDMGRVVGAGVQDWELMYH